MNNKKLRDALLALIEDSIGQEDEIISQQSQPSQESIGSPMQDIQPQPMPMPMPMTGMGQSPQPMPMGGMGEDPSLIASKPFASQRITEIIGRPVKDPKEAFAEKEAEGFFDKLMRDVRYISRDAYNAGRNVSNVVAGQLPSAKDVEYGSRDIVRRVAGYADKVRESLPMSISDQAGIVVESMASNQKSSDNDGLQPTEMESTVSKPLKPSGQSIDSLRNELRSARTIMESESPNKKNVRSVLDALKRYNMAIYERDMQI